MDNNAVKVYVVKVGGVDEAPEDVRILGVYRTEEAAFEARNAEFNASKWGEEEEDDEEFESYGPDLNSTYVDNGVEFFVIEESVLR
jgi:hypothetical protein